MFNVMPELAHIVFYPTRNLAALQLFTHVFADFVAGPQANERPDKTT